MKEWQCELLGLVCMGLASFAALFFAVPSIGMSTTVWLSVGIPVTGWLFYQILGLILYAFGFEVK